MAHLGGGAEAHARSKQYDYWANSSLVLPTHSWPCDSHEPQSLSGKIDTKHFGDRANHGRPLELDEKLKKFKKKREDLLSEPIALAPVFQAKRRRLQEESVLTSTEEGVYQPKTKETRAAYEAMLHVIQFHLGGQPLSIASDAADEILVMLKNDAFKNSDKKKEIEKLLNSITNQVFNQLVSLGRIITDYRDDVDASGSVTVIGDDALDDDVGVAVEFEENVDEEEESDLNMGQEYEEDEDDVAEGNGTGMQMGGEIDDKDMQDANEGMSLYVQDIDAYWLQRKISQAYEQLIDPQQCQKLAEEVLKILAEGSDYRDVENKLLLHLQFEKFSLIKFLLQNQLKIVWCTRLARAEDQEERNKIEEEMVHLGPDLTAIVKQLHATTATSKERQKNLGKSIKEEARRLKDESGGDTDRGRRGVVVMEIRRVIG